jgi:hypothetical protein
MNKRLKILVGVAVVFWIGVLIFGAYIFMGDSIGLGGDEADTASTSSANNTGDALGQGSYVNPGTGSNNTADIFNSTPSGGSPLPVLNGGAPVDTRAVPVGTQPLGSSMPSNPAPTPMVSTPAPTPYTSAPSTSAGNVAPPPSVPGVLDVTLSDDERRRLALENVNSENSLLRAQLELDALRSQVGLPNATPMPPPVTMIYTPAVGDRTALLYWNGTYLEVREGDGVPGTHFTVNKIETTRVQFKTVIGTARGRTQDKLTWVPVQSPAGAGQTTFSGSTTTGSSR